MTDELPPWLKQQIDERIANCHATIIQIDSLNDIVLQAGTRRATVNDEIRADCYREIKVLESVLKMKRRPDDV